MVERPGALELIVGASEDPQFGPVILFGHGGTAAEIIGDTALALPPLNMHLAREVIERTRVFGLLQGFRGRPAAAIDDIALTLIKVSQLIIDFAEVVELDINPLLADEFGVLALDARLRVRKSDQPPSEAARHPALSEGTGGGAVVARRPHLSAAPGAPGGRAGVPEAVREAVARGHPDALLCAEEGACRTRSPRA